MMIGISGRAGGLEGWKGEVLGLWVLVVGMQTRLWIEELEVWVCEVGSYIAQSTWF
jgi:hypothetical protein